jgi:L-lactate dehydrogenase
MRIAIASAGCAKVGECPTPSANASVDARAGQNPNEVAIVGTGRVGITTALTAMLSGIAARFTLVDQDGAGASVEALDLLHGLPFISEPMVRTGGFDSCRGADVVVVAPGVSQMPTDSSLERLRRDVQVMREIVPRIAEQAGDAVLLVVSSSVDVLTRAAVKISCLQTKHVIGMGTMLDTSRLRSLLADHFGVDPHEVHAYVVGEHGESSVITWSLTKVGGVSLDEFARASSVRWNDAIRERIGMQVREAGAQLVRQKGALNFATGLAASRLLRAVLCDDQSVQTVSTVLDRIPQFADVAMSLPCVIGASGCRSAVPLVLDDGEKEALERSAEALRRTYEMAGGP